MSDDPFGFLGDLADEDEPTTDTTSNDDTVEPAGKAPDGNAAPSTRFDNLYDFMNTVITPVLSRKLFVGSAAGLRWDPDWWRYPEAVMRGEMMWRTYEIARSKQDPAEMEAWMRLTVDHHMAILLNGTTGPMHNAGGPQPPLGGTYPPEHPRSATKNAPETKDDNAAPAPQETQ